MSNPNSHPDVIIQYLNEQFPATVGHIPIQQMIAGLRVREADLRTELELMRARNEAVNIQARALAKVVENAQAEIEQWKSDAARLAKIILDVRPEVREESSVEDWQDCHIDEALAAHQKLLEGK